VWQVRMFKSLLCLAPNTWFKALCYALELLLPRLLIPN